MSTAETTAVGESEAEQRAAVQAIYQTIADQLKADVAPATIEKRLVDRGIDADTARQLVANMAKALAENRRGQGMKNVGFGLLWCVGGLIVTVVTYSAASEGGTYVVTWGAILFGGIQLLIGLFQLARAGRS